jgi:5-methyltetrahydropteroyltriglutamate--homocysteine methyltransferase
MSIPSEPIGSIPRPQELIDANHALAKGTTTPERWAQIAHQAVVDTLRRFEHAGSPVVTDGEQTKPSFATYPIHGLPNLAPDGVVIPFADGHTRQLPRLTAGPFRYRAKADTFLRAAKPLTERPMKQAVISASALSLLYPQQGIADYSREQFVADLVDEAAAEIRACIAAGAHNVQMDFTEGRLSLKLDPSGSLLRQFIELNNRVLGQLNSDERTRVGLHTCPGGDRDSTHSADVDYAGLLPELFQTDATNFYIQLASENDRPRVLGIIANSARPNQRIFVGVTDPISTRIETAHEVRDRVLEAARYVPADRLGTTDDCGFSPFGDDTSTARDIAFAKIRARIEGTALAAQTLGL